LENPVTRERAVAIELLWQNAEGRAVAELTALPRARVLGEHLHPSLRERFTVVQGQLTVVRDGRRSVVRAGENADIEPRTWHDRWNEADEDAIVRVEITPGERFKRSYVCAPCGAGAVQTGMGRPLVFCATCSTSRARRHRGGARS
jgi:quercetin dioxygenase-like cupin family protein